MQGDFAKAIFFYKKSIDRQPSAEAHTFLGWAYSLLNKLEMAIQHCQKATEIDPEFGNAWNDIGAYYIKLGKFNEAIPYLERATRCEKYDAPHYPHFNLSRIYAKKGMLRKTQEELKMALKKDPFYAPAIDALKKLNEEMH